MHRCKVHIILVVLFMVAANSSVFALEEKVVNGTIVHDSLHPKLVTTFVEDVVSLLPPEMIQALEPYLETLNREANFNIRDDYWRRKVISMAEFKSRLEGISIQNGNELASQLGGSVVHIFEIALRPNGNDVMSEGLKKNLREVPNRWKNDKFTVAYDGYSGQSLDAILSTLYDYNKRQKMTLYPDLVKTTANLWSAVWQRGGGKTDLVAKTFVRKPLDIDVKKTPGTVNTPSYRR
ncbi:MAG: hypothetical protein M0T70_14860 [Geobacteraceae bacterium]|nr:hypothetical protein [Geobacteraceae bacterium]